MQLLKYEFSKLLHKKIIFFILVLLFIFNIFLFVKSQKDGVYYFDNTLEYQTIVSRYSDVEPNKALSELGEIQNNYRNLSRILYERSIGVDEAVIKHNVQLILDLYAEPITYDEFIHKYAYMIDHEAELKATSAAIDELIEQIKTILSFPEFINSMEEKAENMKSVSIFAKKDSFAYRNIQKTVHDFNDLKQLPLSLGQEDGILSLSRFTLTDYFLLAIILLLSVFLFVEERETGLLPILKSTKFGRLKLAGTKFMVLIWCTLFLSAIFYISNYLAAKESYGFGDTGRYLQSMANFRDAHIPLTVSQYLALLLLIKLFTLILYAVVTSLLFTIISNTKLAFIIIGGMLTLSYLAYTFIYPSSYLNPLKYLNFFSFLDSYRMLAHYNNLNLFGYPISRLNSSLSLMLILMAICLITYLWIFSKSGSKSSSINLIFLKKKNLDYLSRGSVYLLRHELFKVLFSNKGLLLLLVALLLGLINLDRSELFYTEDQYTYESYAQQLAGKLNADKAAFLKDEQQRFDNISGDMNTLIEQYSNKEISKDDYQQGTYALTTFSKFYQSFQKAKEQYEALDTLQGEKDISLHFISTIPSSYIFDDASRDLLLALLYSVFLILCLSNLFCAEYKNGMIKLIRSTKNGRSKLFFNKCSLAYAMATILMFLFYTPIYITLAERYHFTDWSAPIQSVLKYKDFPLEVSIIQFFLLVGVVQLITAFAMVSALLLIAQLLKKQTLTILIGLLVLSVPVIFRYLAPKSFRRFSFADGFDLFQQFSQGNSLVYLCSYVAIILTIIVGAETIAYRKFCNKNFR